MSLTDDILQIVEDKAKEYKLHPLLLQAFVMQESAGQPSATRYEQHYRWLYFPEKFAQQLNIDVDVETANQKTSWGLMQVMGAVAREEGFVDHLDHLLFPRIGMDYGCILLRRLMSRMDYSLSDAISAYNQGGRTKTPGGLYINQRYVDGVMERYRGLGGQP